MTGPGIRIQNVWISPGTARYNPRMDRTHPRGDFDDLPELAAHPGTPLTRLGGSLGIAGCCIGLGVFLLACFGFEKAFALAILPLGMALVGMVLTVVGGVRNFGHQDDHVLSGAFLNLFALVGGLLELAVWQDWTILTRTGATP